MSDYTAVENNKVLSQKKKTLQNRIPCRLGRLKNKPDNNNVT